MLWLLGAAGLIILAALLYFIRIPVQDDRPPAAAPPPPGLSHCPLCGQSLAGSRLYAKLLQYPDGRQQLELRGCGHCYRSGHVLQRKCPRCQAILRLQDTVWADYRLESGVTRVRIQGCPACYRR